MKSSGGAHYVGLDHVRAVAALMVFVWHFTHGPDGSPVVFGAAPWMPIFDEGHTGVALFMVLSGYLFAKLLDGREVNFWAFFWNRFLRLSPLLFLVFLVAGTIEIRHGTAIGTYLKSLVSGLIFPRWPNGGWSITVEIHFYLALPLLLYLRRRWPFAPLIAVACAILLRTVMFMAHGDIQDAAYWTIIGRADDFLLGITAFTYRDHIRCRQTMVLTIAVLFLMFFASFDALGGFYHIGQESPIWIFLPTVEAVCYSTLVAYYDTTFSPRATGFSRLWSKVGEYSYSIYLLHFFIVFRMATYVERNIMDISNFYVALVWAIACFALMIPIGFISYNYFEKPFLRMRRNYIRLPSSGVSRHVHP